MTAFCHRCHGKPHLQHATPVRLSGRYRKGTARSLRLLSEPSASLQKQRSALCGPMQQSVAPRRSVTTAAQPNSSGSWYEQGSKTSQPSGSIAAASSPDSSKQSSRHYYDSTPKQRFSATQGEHQHQKQHRQSQQQSDDGLGWWEVPRESRNTQQSTATAAASAAAAELDLESWQEERLLIAAAGSKKKMQVQALAADLGLDRSEVLSWIATFRAKPKQEQQKLLAPLQHIIQQQQQQHVGNDLWSDLATTNNTTTSSSSNGSLPFSEPNANTGFVPFHARRDTGGKYQGKRLPGEVLRTLEGVYSRSPWPSREIVAGLHDLHRLPRDVVLEWFTARREMDGLPDNPRLAKKAAAAAAGAAAGRTEAQQSILSPTPQQQQQPAPQAALDRPTVKQQQGQNSQAAAAAAAAGPAVSRLTARELAALRSSLPSPKKFKGAKLNEELGIKEGGGSIGTVAKQVEISGVVFVARDGAAAWRRVWRRRRALSGLPAQRLDLNKWLPYSPSGPLTEIV